MHHVAPAAPNASDAGADPGKALREALKGGPPQTAIGLRATTYVLHATGGTRDEVESNMRDAIAFHLDGLREDGAPVPEPRAVASYVEVAA